MKSFLRLLGVLSVLAGPVQAKVVIVALGDSMTSGTPYCRSPLESPPDGAGDFDAPYTAWIMKRQEDWEVINAGISGQRTDEIRNRTDKALAPRPRYLVVLAGANDILQNIPLNLTAKNLFEIYKKAKSVTTIPVAVTVPPINRATPEQAKRIDELNAWIIKASDRLRIPLADLNLALRNPQDPHRSSSSEDGIHPDPGGYRRMGLVIADVIAGMESALRR